VIPRDYVIGGDNADRVAAGLAAAGCRRVAEAADGDIVELQVSPGQRHLAVLCEGGAVHAHFGVGRVVEAPLPDAWTVIAAWRLPEL
jgi:murein DD-endopeptidase / murein LD-carboxypeptidase